MNDVSVLARDMLLQTGYNRHGRQIIVDDRCYNACKLLIKLRKTQTYYIQCDKQLLP